MTGDENRVRLRKDVLMRLRKYLAENGKSAAGVPGVTLDENVAVTEIVMNFLTEKGYWPKKNQEE
jgi:hypothetical protein